VGGVCTCMVGHDFDSTTCMQFNPWYKKLRPYFGSFFIFSLNYVNFRKFVNLCKVQKILEHMIKTWYRYMYDFHMRYMSCFHVVVFVPGQSLGCDRIVSSSYHGGHVMLLFSPAGISTFSSSTRIIPITLATQKVSKNFDRLIMSFCTNFLPYIRHVLKRYDLLELGRVLNLNMVSAWHIKSISLGHSVWVAWCVVDLSEIFFLTFQNIGYPYCLWGCECFFSTRWFLWVMTIWNLWLD
jgi:hypothetical protein